MDAKPSAYPPTLPITWRIILFLRSRAALHRPRQLLADHRVDLAIDGDEAVGGSVALVLGQVDIDQAFELRGRPGLHDPDPGRQDDRLVDVVGDEQDGLAGRPPDLHQLP